MFGDGMTRGPVVRFPSALLARYSTSFCVSFRLLNSQFIVIILAFQTIRLLNFM